jgi:hypothetical protein
MKKPFLILQCACAAASFFVLFLLLAWQRASDAPMQETSRKGPGQEAPLLPTPPPEYDCFSERDGEVDLVIRRGKTELAGTILVIDQMSGRKDADLKFLAGTRGLVFAVPPGKKWIVILPTSLHRPLVTELEVRPGKGRKLAFGAVELPLFSGIVLDEWLQPREALRLSFPLPPLYETDWKKRGLGYFMTGGCAYRSIRASSGFNRTIRTWGYGFCSTGSVSLVARTDDEGRFFFPARDQRMAAIKIAHAHAATPCDLAADRISLLVTHCNRGMADESTFELRLETAVRNLIDYTNEVFPGSAMSEAEARERLRTAVLGSDLPEKCRNALAERILSE